MKSNNKKRTLIKGISAVCLLSFFRVGFAQTQILSARIWPSTAYTRITIESNYPIKYKTFELKNPNRLAIDLHNFQLSQSPVLRLLSQTVSARDPYIRAIRVGQNSPNSVRIVIELKQPIAPDIFSLNPVSNFKHRFVIDLYPKNLNQIEDRDEQAMVSLLESFNSGKPIFQKTVRKQKPNVFEAPKKRAKGKFLIVIDPGHGGEDTGAIGAYNTQEKDVVLQISYALKKVLQKDKRFEIVMTREDDVFIPLQVRAARAQVLKADMFISIHADAFTRSSAHGSSVFILSSQGGSSSIASYLAKTQNRSNLLGGIGSKNDNYTNSAILDLVHTKTHIKSNILAQQILLELERVNTLHKRTVERAQFAVLKSIDIPSVLVETAFISNPEERMKLISRDFQYAVANAIYKGINNYLILDKF